MGVADHDQARRGVVGVQEHLDRAGGSTAGEPLLDDRLLLGRLLDRVPQPEQARGEDRGTRGAAVPGRDAVDRAGWRDVRQARSGGIGRAGIGVPAPSSPPGSAGRGRSPPPTGQPPATAGMIEIVSPSGTGVDTPSR